MDKPHTDYRLTGIEAAEPAPLCGEFYTGFYREPRNTAGQAVRNCHCDVRMSLTQRVIQGIPMEAEAQWSGGLDRSSEEVSVMGMERRVQLIHLP